MNWNGGAKARAQNGRRVGGFFNPSRPEGDRTRTTKGDVATDPRYRLMNDTSDQTRQRTVPLLEYVKEHFKNGDAMALMLTHQMQIDTVHLNNNKRRRFNSPSASSSSVLPSASPSASERNEPLQTTPSNSNSPISISVSVTPSGSVIMEPPEDESGKGSSWSTNQSSPNEVNSTSR